MYLMIDVLQYTPNLRYLETDLKTYFNQSLVNKYYFINYENENFLQNMTNLFHLKIKIIHFLCKWKQIIINYLTKLKIFEFKMNI